MSKVFVYVGMSLDGFIAGPHRGPKNLLGDRGPTIHQWMYQQRAFIQALELGSVAGGETGDDNRMLESVFARTGTTIIGKRMFEEGEANWPKIPPFHTPVFVVTHEHRAPLTCSGDTTFFFCNDGIEATLRRAREVAGGKDIRIGGGANLVRQYLNAGLVDELGVAVAPVILGDGLRLFDGVDRHLRLDALAAQHSARVTHLRYAVRKH